MTPWSGDQYSLPAGTPVSPNTTIQSTWANTLTADLESGMNFTRPVARGGTGSTTAVGAFDNLSTISTDIASSATTDLSTATGVHVTITGATTITGFGTEQAGAIRILTFDDALTLTHNATSLILPGAANITTAAGDVAVFVSEGSGNWRCVNYQAANSDTFVDLDVADISGGVLTIPNTGTYFQLTGHGAADFSIEEFGDERPVGKAFFLLVPRTIADTGGVANSLGNKVSLIHSASGAGLDMTIARRSAGLGTFLYTYEAYPDACNVNGDAINLYELLMFVPVGSGRHECRQLPEDMEFRTANAFVRRSALGMQEVAYRGNLTTPSSGTVTWTFPATFASDDYGFSASSTSNSTAVGISIHAPAQTTGSISFRAMSSSGTQVQTSTRPMAIGNWKS